MSEADLQVHLASQTELRIRLFDVLRLNEPSQSDEFAALHSMECDAILFDVLYPQHLPRIGAAIQELVDREPPKFVLGSSGIEYALSQFWEEKGLIESLRSHPSGQPKFSATEQLVVITGSCSPVNARQVAWAEQNGFEAIAIDTASLVDPTRAEREIAFSVERALDFVDQGANVILHSSRGPDDPRITATISAFRSLGFSDLDIKLRSGRTLGPNLGKILNGIVAQRQFTRVGVAGGDTSGYIANELGITALEAIAPVAPGSPLCRAYADNAMDGIEFFFKGGQVGKDDVWGTMLSGTE